MKKYRLLTMLSNISLKEMPFHIAMIFPKAFSDRKFLQILYKHYLKEDLNLQYLVNYTFNCLKINELH